MRLLLSLLALLLIPFTGFSQKLEPVSWSTKVENIAPGEFNLIATALIEPEWHLYSQHTADGGGLPLELKWKNNGQFELIGPMKESKTHTAFNDIFEVDETFFEGKAVLTQRIKMRQAGIKTIQLQLDYQVCKDVCINGKEQLSFAIPTYTLAETAAVATPEDATVATAETANPVLATPTVDSTSTQPETAIASDTVAEVEQEEATDSSANRSLGSTFFLAFLGGFAALLTPCVFPLIPMTVSYFTKASKDKAAGKRNAILYGISIILIYVLLGSLVVAIFGASALNELSTNVYFNLAFFVILVIFAMSFLGAFELVLPSSWANKVDQQADKGGIIGILFMALALAIVSFSCTGPIVGTLLFESASQGGIGPIVGMLGFSTALALPFMLFALFPSWLNSLPKSGGWLNTVKVFLGFLELAFAFKFLSNADLVSQWHLLEREVFIAIWIAVFGALALYLFGKIRLPHDSPITHISVGRLMLALLVSTFTIYLIPGLWGAPLKLISAFPPPISYSESPYGFGATATPASTTTALPEGAKLEHGFIVFTDYQTGLNYAQQVNKPILLDFTGHACVNCRKMENNVWSEKDVHQFMAEQVVLISLYVDERTKLPAAEQYESEIIKGRVETVGDKWTEFQLRHFQANVQPLYAVQTPQGKTVGKTQSYSSKDAYFSWLKTQVELAKK